MTGRVIVGASGVLAAWAVSSFVACAKPPQPKVCEAPPPEAPRESSYIGMCTLDLPDAEPPMSTADAASTSDAELPEDASGNGGDAEYPPPK